MHKLSQNIQRAVRAAAIIGCIDVMIEIVVSIVLSYIVGDPLPFFIVLFAALPLSLYLIVVVNSLANQVRIQ